MPKKRTRKQKTRAQYHYALPSNHSFTGIEAASSSESRPQAPKPAAHVNSLYLYDPAFIAKDLGKTMLVSFIILSVQIGLYFWLR